MNKYTLTLRREDGFSLSFVGGQQARDTFKRYYQVIGFDEYEWRLRESVQ